MYTTIHQHVNTCICTYIHESIYLNKTEYTLPSPQIATHSPHIAPYTFPIVFVLLKVKTVILHYLTSTLLFHVTRNQHMTCITQHYTNISEISNDPWVFFVLPLPSFFPFAVSFLFHPVSPLPFSFTLHPPFPPPPSFSPAMTHLWICRSVPGVALHGAKSGRVDEGRHSKKSAQYLVDCIQ